MKKVLFLNLMAFEHTGGLEKFNRCFLKALAESEKEVNVDTLSYSLCDTKTDERYYPADKYTGFGLDKLKFTLSSIKKGLQSDWIILGHINLAIIGFLIKLIAPSKKIVLVCHGIEVWGPVSGIKKRVLKSAQKILAVSSYTKSKIAKVHGIDADKIEVFHNTIDPYFTQPVTFGKDKTLLSRYGFNEHDFVLFTLCRVSSKEQYKGYDKVIQAMGKLKGQYPGIKYLIAGKYDDSEKGRLQLLSNDNGIKDDIVFAGFIKDEEIAAHYQLGDIYIMPSRGEGFGIVFIEALACGRAVIAGNTDGSRDAVANGALGTLVNPTSVDEIAKAIETYFEDRKHWSTEKAKMLQQQAIAHFGFEHYKSRLANIIRTLA